MRDVHAGSTLLARSLILALGLALTACAGGPGGDPGGADGGAPARPGLFISPFGEPFVSQPGEAWPVAAWFAGADRDRDGVITPTEFAADGQRWFHRLDSDGDGRLDATELAAYEVSLHQFGGGPGDGGPRGAGPGGGWGGGGHHGRGGGGGRRGGGLSLGEPQDAGRRAPDGEGGYGSGSRSRLMGYGRIAEAGFFNLPEPVKAADVNVDQRVTAEEWAQATERWFHALDPDQDGKLTLATLPQTPLQARGGVSRRGRGGHGRP